MKITQITFTRFLAAMAIVVFHFGNNLFVYEIDYISEIFSRANVGVSYFFILSGFIMIVAYNGKGKIDYLEYCKNRFARIYPLYVVGLLLILAVKYNVEAYKFFLYLFGLQSWIPGEALVLNFPGWSISVEFFFYLLFPLLYNYFYSKNNKGIWIFTIAVWIITQVYSNYYMNFGLYEGEHTESHDFIHYFPLLHVNEFLMGNLAGIYFVNNFRQRNYDLPIILIFFGVLFSLIFVPLFFHNGLMALFFIPLIILISFNNGQITKLFSKKPFEYLGEMSYAVYITHIPVLRLLRHILFVNKIKMDINVQFFVFVIILMISSALFYQFIEKPMRNYLKKISFNGPNS